MRRSQTLRPLACQHPFRGEAEQRRDGDARGERQGCSDRLACQRQLGMRND